MWPFNRKPKEPSPKPWQVVAVEQLEAWRPIGGRFEYLGRECSVSRHYRVEHWPGLPLRLSPGISADYADDNGVIHSITFSWPESKALMESQP